MRKVGSAGTAYFPVSSLTKSSVKRYIYGIIRSMRMNCVYRIKHNDVGSCISHI
jgi:hypothetical protein